MSLMRSLYFSGRIWMVFIFLIAGFVMAYIFPPLFPVFKILLLLAGFLVITDVFVLFKHKNGVFAQRSHADRLSNGDENDITLFLENRYGFSADIEVIDEIPHQFQRRDVFFTLKMKASSAQQVHYQLRPLTRGMYSFGQINVFVLTPLGLAKRRYKLGAPADVAVYPSYLQMRQYALLAVANRLSEVGVRRIRRIGHSMEFDQVRSYVPGDDQRSVNWKATARRGDVMVNSYEDEKQQSVYCLIDKGRAMQSPFDGLTLLDYAINATLVMSNIALIKDDKAGLITFSETLGQVVQADRRSGHLQKLMEILYRQKTKFMETDFERLWAAVRTQVRQRSLFLLFTNFETVEGMQRQLPFLRRMAKDHLLVVVLFENTEIKYLIDTPAETLEHVYRKTIARRFANEKKRIATELGRYGIQTILTPPKLLTANTINKYLELKARGAI
jgi:uncharacterized protein (DUF58 family)